MNSSVKPLFHLPKVEEEDETSGMTMAFHDNKRHESSSVTFRNAAETVVPPKKVKSKPRSEDINDNAEAFIRKFRQQLLLQRVESIE